MNTILASEEATPSRQFNSPLKVSLFSPEYAALTAKTKNKICNIVKDDVLVKINKQHSNTL